MARKKMKRSSTRRAMSKMKGDIVSIGRHTRSATVKSGRRVASKMGMTKKRR
jgi:hypothetical protein